MGTGGSDVVGAGGGPGLVGAERGDLAWWDRSGSGDLAWWEQRGGPGLSPPRFELLLATPELDLC